MKIILSLIVMTTLVAGLYAPAGAQTSDPPRVAAANHDLAPGDALPHALPDGQPVNLSRDGSQPALRSFVIEGEDRVSITFDRPRLDLDLDPRSAPGLDWETSWDLVDPVPGVLARTALTPCPFTARPWLNELAMDQVVVFSPEAPPLAAWKISIVDSRGLTVHVKTGQGDLPASLAWNGRRDDGSCAWPGLIYSFVLETEDPAGNQRTVSGRGFTLPAYRLTGETEDVLVLSGTDLESAPLVEESVSWLNQAPGLEQPIVIRATARDRAQANHLARRTADLLASRLCGDPGRLMTEIQVVDDAPDPGIIEVVASAGS